ncbi:hypothetical protein SPFL3101_00462 [Sporomusaceae bacterium FL31]|nr:hypothetical protein SPFL3101_00462 [Sporomusaceae bacterium FL31]
MCPFTAHLQKITATHYVNFVVQWDMSFVEGAI